MRAWEIALAGLFLGLCLVAGIFIQRSAGVRELAGGAPNIGVVRFDGEIDFATANTLITLLDTARRDESVAGVVLEVLSPGGYATSSESIFYTLLKLREEKPLVVVIDGLAASGGYYMAAAGNRIFATSSAYVGNVGTRGGRPSDPSITPDELSSGPYKLEGGSRFDQVHQLDLVARSFIQNVATQRAGSPVNPLKLSVDELGEARLYLGSEALALGLIDGEGGRADGIEAAAELAGLDSYEVVDLPAYLGLPAAPDYDTDGLQSGTNAIVSRRGVQEMVAQAPPGTIYMLDSRIALPDDALPPALQGLPPKEGGDPVFGGQSSSSAPSSWAGALLRPAPAGSGTP